MTSWGTGKPHRKAITGNWGCEKCEPLGSSWIKGIQAASSRPDITPFVTGSLGGQETSNNYGQEASFTFLKILGVGDFLYKGFQKINVLISESSLPRRVCHTNPHPGVRE